MSVLFYSVCLVCVFDKFFKKGLNLFLGFFGVLFGVLGCI